MSIYPISHLSQTFSEALPKATRTISLIVTIAIVILLLGSVIYWTNLRHFFATLLSKEDQSVNELETLMRPIGLSDNQLKVLRSVCDDGIAITPFSFKAWKSPLEIQPLDSRISLLASVNEKAYKALCELLKKYRHPEHNAWEQEEVIEMADTCMKISYQISYLTMRELPNLVNHLARKGITRTLEKALTTQDSYTYRSFFYAPRIYNEIRAGMRFQKFSHDSWQFRAKGMVEGFDCPADDELSPDFKKQFHQEGKLFNQMRLLYNDYCDQVLNIVDKDKLKESDQRYVSYITKDDNPDNFFTFPDNFPT